jgi:flagellar FliL protein
VKKKLIIVLPILLLAVGGGLWKFMLAPAPAKAKPKIEGVVVQLPKEFVVNLAGGHYGKVSVALVMEGHAGGGHGAPPAEGTAGLAQEAAIRAIVTDELTGVHKEEIISRPGRAKLVKHIVKRIHHDTDEHVTDVLFTDIAVQ